MPSLSQIQKFIKYDSKDTSDKQSSDDFQWGVPHPLLQAHFGLLPLQNAFDIMLEIVDIVSMLSCFIPKIHRIIRDEEHEDECHGEHHAIESLVQIDQSHQTACHTAVDRRKSSGRKEIVPIETLILYPIDHQFDKLDDDNHQQWDEYWVKRDMHRALYGG